jgi:hypothetical protein
MGQKHNVKSRRILLKKPEFLMETVKTVKITLY